MTAHRTLHDLHKANFRVNDPGDGGTIDVGSRNFTVCELVTAGASETRTVPQPLRSGQRLTLAVKTDGGDVTLTFTGGFNQAGTTTTQLADANDYISVESVASGSSYVWRVVSAEGASNQTFVLGDAAITEAELETIDGVTAGTVTASKAVVVDASKNIATFGTLGSATITIGNDDTTDGVVNGLVIGHSSSDNNATAGDGVGVSLKLENATGTSTYEEWASIDAVSTTITNGSEDGDIVVSTMLAGTVTEAIRIDASDQSLTLGKNATDANGIQQLRLFPLTASRGSFILKPVANDGDTTVTLSNAAMGQASVVSIPDPGAATANVMLTDQANDGALITATAAEINVLDGVTGGTVTANKAVVVDVSKNIATLGTIGSATITIGNDDTTDGVVDGLVVGHSSSDNNATAGDGIGISLKLENATGTSTYEEWASIDVVSTTITDGSEDGDVVVSAMLAGTVTEAARIDASDQSLTIGRNATDANGIQQLRLFPLTATTGSMIIKPVANDGDTTVTISNDAMGQASTIAIPDPGAATAEFLLTTADNDGVPVTATSAELNQLDGNILADAATTEGAGITSHALVCEHSVVKVGGIYKTEILLDLTGLESTVTDGDIIGDSGGGAAHIGQITAARNGTIIFGKVTCLETPAGGDDNISIYSATENTGAYDGAIGDLTETLLQAHGAWVAAEQTPDILDTVPPANGYLYLAAKGADTAGTYTAGIFLIELWGK